MSVLSTATLMLSRLRVAVLETRNDHQRWRQHSRRTCRRTTETVSFLPGLCLSNARAKYSRMLLWGNNVILLSIHGVIVFVLHCARVLFSISIKPTCRVLVSRVDAHTWYSTRHSISAWLLRQNLASNSFTTVFLWSTPCQFSLRFQAFWWRKMKQTCNGAIKRYFD